MNVTINFNQFKLLIFYLSLSIFFGINVNAKTIVVTPHDNLQKIINNSAQGDIIELTPGRYLGNFIVEQGITLRGSQKEQQPAIIDAQGKGNALFLNHSDITVEDLSIVNWGNNLTDENAGIFTDRKGSHIVIKNNKLSGDGFGMWLQKGQYINVINNTVVGNAKLRSADRGNGIQLSIIQHAVVKNNVISHTRDGLYIISSQHNLIQNNTMHDLRYGIHYMYAHSNNIINNHAYKTRACYALMSSKNLQVNHNDCRDSEDYGFLLNFITSSTITNNYIDHIWTKKRHKIVGREGKGLFVYNSSFNTISNNTIKNTEIGIHLTAGSKHTKIFGNSFINNPIQVKYVSTAKQEWSLQGKGNFWSNYLGWDMNNDHIGDTVFTPNDGIDTLIWQYPELKMLMDSPAILVLRWVQRQFPVLKPPGITDSFPLMQSPSLSLVKEP